MLKHNDTEILSHISWSLSHLCDGPCTHIQAVVNSEACAMLVQLLSNGSWRVTKPALRAIGNIVCAEDDHDYTQVRHIDLVKDSKWISISLNVVLCHYCDN